METRSESATPLQPILTLPPTTLHGHIAVRAWSNDLAPSLAASANNRAIWLNLRDRMPSPYTLADANWWIDHCSEPEHWPHVLTFNESGVETVGEKKSCEFAIVASNPRTGNDETIGSIGLVVGSDVARRTAELGYWLAEAYWGKAIMGEVVRGFLRWVWEAFPGMVRVHGEVFANNERSVGVLKKNGFEYEGRQRAAAWKDGKVGDTLAYACLRPGPESSAEAWGCWDDDQDGWQGRSEYGSS